MILTSHQLSWSSSSDGCFMSWTNVSLTSTVNRETSRTSRSAGWCFYKQLFLLLYMKWGWSSGKLLYGDIFKTYIYALTCIKQQLKQVFPKSWGEALFLFILPSLEIPRLPASCISTPSGIKMQMQSAAKIFLCLCYIFDLTACARGTAKSSN